MKSSLFALLLCPLMVASGAEMRPLRLGQDDWFGNPLMWRVREDGIHVANTNGHSVLMYEAGVVSDEVCVEASLTPLASAKKNWEFAGVVIAEDKDNFWHLALARTPPDKGNTPFMELCELREGHWLAHTNLKQEYGERPNQDWAFGKTYRLRLSMDKEGVSGTITDAEGNVMFRQRYLFSAPAVTRGRPALRVSDMSCGFTALAAASGAALPEKGAAGFPAYAGMDRAVSEVRSKATGFFRVEQGGDGRWWTIDPLGRGIVMLGVDHVTFRGHWCEKLGYAPHGRKNEKKYADKGEWEAETLGRLKAWGFTMMGAGCAPELNHRGFAHTIFLSIGDHFAGLGDEYDIAPNLHIPCSAFPNVFHPDFEVHCTYHARLMCAPNKDDPWLFGYFIDNELAWWGCDGWGAQDTGLFDTTLRKGPAHTAKLALRDYLKAEAKGDIGAFNILWGTSLKTFDDLPALTALPHATDAQRAAKLGFLRLAADRYFSVAARAIRAADPNHLVLGARFAGTAGAHPEVWSVSGQYCDIVTFNCYPMADLDEGRVYDHFGRNGELVTDHFAKYYGYVKRPMMVTEWSFPALDAGLPSVHGAGQRYLTQDGRTAATKLFARTMLSLPFILGYDYFMWVDEPALGISKIFPEDSNYGLINEDGQPYELLTSMFTELHREAAAWRFKPAPEALRKPDAHIPDATAMARKIAVKGAAPATYTSDGTSFTLDNGVIRLAGKIAPGRMIQEVTDAKTGAAFGAYNAMIPVLTANGNTRWLDTGHVTAVQGRVEGGIAVADITATAHDGDIAFEVTHRLMLPPGSPWFVSEFISAKNTGTAPLHIKGIMFRQYSPFSDTPDKLPPNLWGVPTSGCWIDKASGRYFGAAASRRSGIQIYFWTDGPARYQHPDARLELDLLLAPGDTYRPPAPVHILCLTGTGDADAWLTLMKSLTTVF